MRKSIVALALVFGAMQAFAETAHVITLTPLNGTIDGGTRVTIIGEGFAAPLRVFFDETEATVISVLPNQVIVIAPPHPAGTASLRVGDIRVPNAFEFFVEPTIVGVSAPQGLFTGGTHVIIHGTNFVPPVAVTAAGVAATVLSVTPTEVVALTGPAPADCSDRTGPIEVVNVDSGDVAYGPDFTYVTPRPYFASIPALTAGKTAGIVVGNAYGPAQFTIGNRSVAPAAAVENKNGTTTFTLSIPALQATACDDPPLVVAITFANPATGCTISDKVVIHPSRAGCRPSPPRR